MGAELPALVWAVGQEVAREFEMRLGKAFENTYGGDPARKAS
jgi:hypothetical protein